MRYSHMLRRSLAALALVAAACDTTVTNPGPVPDDGLNTPLAYNAVVIGARLQLARAYGSDAGNGGQLAYWGGVIAFEINPAGSTGSFGIPTSIQTGEVSPAFSSDDWTAANLARFVAEDALRRFAANSANPLTAPKPNQNAEAAVYAGYANRLLGENFCEAVIPVTNADGSLSPGSLSPFTDYFTRAETHFTNALAFAAQATGTDTVRAKQLRDAAWAGRASVRADLASYGLGTWANAASDAALVTSNTMTFQLPFSAQDQNQYNYIYWARGNAPYRAHTQWGTFYEGYFRTSKTVALPAGDTRVRWDTTALTGDAAVSKFLGLVPFWPEAKHTAQNSPINLSSGWEMRLIEAEAALAGNDVATAVARMNLRRTNLGLPTYSAAISVDSGWTLLKLERGLELWLEARRLGDLRRWITNSVPGTAQDGLYRANITDFLHTSPIETMTAPPGRSQCFPVGQNESDTNPNIP